MQPQANHVHHRNEPELQRALAARYTSTRAQTGRLAQPFCAEDCALQSMPERAR